MLIDKDDCQQILELAEVSWGEGAGVPEDLVKRIFADYVDLADDYGHLLPKEKHDPQEPR